MNPHPEAPPLDPKAGNGLPTPFTPGLLLGYSGMTLNPLTSLKLVSPPPPLMLSLVTRNLRPGWWRWSAPPRGPRIMQWHRLLPSQEDPRDATGQCASLLALAMATSSTTPVTAGRCSAAIAVNTTTCRSMRRTC